MGWEGKQQAERDTGSVRCPPCSPPGCPPSRSRALLPTKPPTQPTIRLYAGCVFSESVEPQPNACSSVPSGGYGVVAAGQCGGGWE